MGKSWQKVLFFGNMIFTTFFIVKEIPPTSGDFYDKICIGNFWKKFQLKTSQNFKGIYDSMPPLLSREKFHQLQPFECCLSGLSQIFKYLDLEKIQSVPDVTIYFHLSQMWQMSRTPFCDCWRSVTCVLQKSVTCVTYVTLFVCEVLLIYIKLYKK